MRRLIDEAFADIGMTLRGRPVRQRINPADVQVEGSASNLVQPGVGRLAGSQELRTVLSRRNCVTGIQAVLDTAATELAPGLRQNLILGY